MRFGEKALVYNRWAIPQKRSAEWVAEWIEKDCSGLRGLEMGAGTGVFTQHLIDRGFERLTAVEKSIRMAAEGRKSFPACEWIVGDAWCFNGSPVDRIYSCSLLQWATDPLSALKLWRRNLSDSGRLLCGIYTLGSLAGFQKIDPSFSAVTWRSANDWYELLTQAGFHVQRMEEKEDVDRFDNSKEALHSIHCVGAVNERRRTVSQLRSFLRECDATSPGGFSVEWRTLRIEATVD